MVSKLTNAQFGTPKRASQEEILNRLIPHTNWISWSADDNLRPVTGAKQTSKRFGDAQKTADALSELVLAAVPKLPLADATTPDTQLKRGRPVTPRRLLREGFDRVVDASNAVLSIVGEIAVAVVQKTLDEMRGHAFPTLADNKHLTDKLLETCQQHGIHLYFENGGTLLHIGIRAVSAPGTKKTNPATPAALAGVFNLSAYRADQSGSSSVTTLALFPPLIAARSLEQAQKIRAERKK